MYGESKSDIVASGVINTGEGTGDSVSCNLGDGVLTSNSDNKSSVVGLNDGVSLRTAGVLGISPNIVFMSICFYCLLSSVGTVHLMTSPVHIFVSNQSLENPISIIKIELDGKQIFQKQMATGTQHNWEEIKDGISLSEGRHTLLVSEVNSNTNKSQEFIVESELWIVITFHGQQSGFKIEIFDRPIGFM